MGMGTKENRGHRKVTLYYLGCSLLNIATGWTACKLNAAFSHFGFVEMELNISCSFSLQQDRIPTES